jgi:hypothetical protein
MDMAYFSRLLATCALSLALCTVVPFAAMAAAKGGGQARVQAAAYGSGVQAAANPYRQLQALDTQMTRIAYRLTTANVPFCKAVQGHVGIALHTAGQYRDKGREAFGFVYPVQVLAIAPGSPAAQSDVRLDDGVIGIDGAMMDGALGNGPGGQNRRGGEQLTAVMDLMQRRIDIAFIEERPAQWQFWRDGQLMSVPLTPVAACRARWQIMAGNSDHAGTDGQIVTISVDIALLAIEAGGDDGLAAVAAHELAHIMLEHRVYLGGLESRLRTARGEEARALRKTLTAAQKQAERDADLLSQWLLTNAGYASEPGLAFHKRLASRELFGYSPKHGSSKDRIAAMRAEQADVMATPPDAMGLRAPPLLLGKGTYPW